MFPFRVPDDVSVYIFKFLDRPLVLREVSKSFYFFTIENKLLQKTIWYNLYRKLLHKSHYYDLCDQFPDECVCTIPWHYLKRFRPYHSHTNYYTLARDEVWKKFHKKLWNEQKYKKWRKTRELLYQLMEDRKQYQRMEEYMETKTKKICLNRR